MAKQLAIKQILEHAIASHTEVEQRCSANMANCSLSELIACLNTHHELYASALQAAPDCEKSKNEIVHELISQSERALRADWAEVPSTYTTQHVLKQGIPQLIFYYSTLTIPSLKLSISTLRNVQLGSFDDFRTLYELQRDAPKGRADADTFIDHVECCCRVLQRIQTLGEQGELQDIAAEIRREEKIREFSRSLAERWLSPEVQTELKWEHDDGSKSFEHYLEFCYGVCLCLQRSI